MVERISNELLKKINDREFNGLDELNLQALDTLDDLATDLVTARAEIERLKNVDEFGLCTVCGR